jgi:hypothetical protein
MPAKKRVVKAAGGGGNSGPLTLRRARAMAAGPRRAAVAGSPSPRRVGQERQNFEREHDDEIQRRIQQYRAVMRILDERGVKGLEEAPAGRRDDVAAAPAPAPRLLRILAEGDSWFDYPVPLFGGGVIPRLAERLGVEILNLAKAGDEVRFMLGVKQRRELANQLRGRPPVDRGKCFCFPVAATISSTIP